MRRLVLVMLFFGLSMAAAATPAYRRLKTSEVGQLKQAIEDEIYDYGYFTSFYDIGENVGTPRHWKARIHLFVNPVYDSGRQSGVVIYKLMPYGEIYRLFGIDRSDHIELDGDPENRFPITQPSHQTVFMDELDVCRFERSWRDTFLVVDTQPTLEMIKEAAQRQKERTGFSDWEYRHPEAK